MKGVTLLLLEIGQKGVAVATWAANNLPHERTVLSPEHN
jgi:hypothetical protein